jgi:hypothetical protein
MSINIGCIEWAAFIVEGFQPFGKYYSCHLQDDVFSRWRVESHCKEVALDGKCEVQDVTVET